MFCTFTFYSIIPIILLYTQTIVAIDRNEKAMLVAGDTQQLLSLYQKVYQVSKTRGKGGKNQRNNNKKNNSNNNNSNNNKLEIDMQSATGFEGIPSKNRKNKGGKLMNAGLPASDDDEIMSVRIGEMKVTKAQLDEVEKKPKGSLNSYTSATTFMLASMVQRLSIRPQQAAALLDSNRRYLTHILMHGIKSSYEPILRWMQYISKNIEAFGAVLVRDVKTAPVDKMRRGMRSIEQGFTLGYSILSALQPGILSHNADVAKKTCEILAALGAALSRAKLDRVGWRWFVGK